MQLPDDFKEFIELMNTEGVTYVMIGGYAYNLYRNPRATGDIDFLLELTTENERRIRRVLVQFGFGSTLPPIETLLLSMGQVIMLGRSPLRIDLLTQIDGVSFEEVYNSRQYTDISGIPVPAISAEELYRNKLAAGRLKDLADAAELERFLKSKRKL